MFLYRFLGHRLNTVEVYWLCTGDCFFRGTGFACSCPCVGYYSRLIFIGVGRWGRPPNNLVGGGGGKPWVVWEVWQFGPGSQNGFIRCATAITDCLFENALPDRWSYSERVNGFGGGAIAGATGLVLLQRNQTLGILRLYLLEVLEMCDMGTFSVTSFTEKLYGATQKCMEWG